MKKSSSLSVKSVSLGGILLALVTIVLLLAIYSPVNKLSLYALSSFFIAVMIIVLGIKAGWLFYISSCLLALIVIPDKIGVIPYLAFFGVYGMVKLYIERLDKLILEYILKLAYFNLFVIVSLQFIKGFFQENLFSKIPFPLWAVLVILELLFLVYDYVFTLFIQYFNSKLRRLIKK
jgi:hypothetical protein